MLPIGTDLVTVVDTQCLMKKRSSESNQNDLSVLVSQGKFIFDELKHQSFSYQLVEETQVSTLEERANLDSCLIGISYNHTYKIEASFNDPDVSMQNHLSALNLPYAYDSFYDPFYGMPLIYNGREAVIAIIDTGIDYNHPDLHSRMWSNSKGYGIDARTIGTANVSYDPMDISPISHGTHVAGIAGASGNNGIGVVGVMPYYAKLMAIRVFYLQNGDYYTDSNTVANAIGFAVANGADIINLSLGRITEKSDSDPVYYNAIGEALANEVVVVAAIGNGSNGDSGNLVDGTSLSSYPAMYGEALKGMITVGSFDSQTSDWSQFSHYSSKYVEISAPGAESAGVGIYSTVTRVPFHLNKDYSRLSGTSMSTPMVSAAAGLTVGLLRNTFGRKPKAAEVERLILNSAIEDVRLANYVNQGRRLDIRRLASLIQQTYPETYGQSGSFSSMGCR